MYDKLFIFLKVNDDNDEIVLPLEQIEEIIGRKLPKKAYTEMQRWENSESHSQARSWLNAGWKVESPSDVVKTGRVKFIKQKDNSNESKTGISFSCTSLVYMILIPVIPLGFALFYFFQEKNELAIAYLKIFLYGLGITLIIYILSIIF